MEGGRVTCLVNLEDVYLCAETQQDLQGMLSELEDALAGCGLSFQPSKCAWLGDGTQEGRSLMFGASEVFTRVDEFMVPGKTRPTRRYPTGSDKLGGAFFVHRRLRLVCSKKLPLAARYKVFRSVLTVTCMRGLETFRLTQRQRKALSTTHLTLASRMWGLSWAPYATWTWRDGAGHVPGCVAGRRGRGARKMPSANSSMRDTWPACQKSG